MKDRRRRKILMLVCIVMCAVSLVSYAYSTSVNSPDRFMAKEYILANHDADTGALNAVTSIYLNYRLWDTLFESMVLLLSALAVITLSWSKSDEE